MCAVAEKVSACDECIVSLASKSRPGPCGTSSANSIIGDSLRSRALSKVLLTVRGRQASKPDSNEASSAGHSKRAEVSEHRFDTSEPSAKAVMTADEARAVAAMV